jgi:hypothetical protein
MDAKIERKGKLIISLAVFLLNKYVGWLEPEEHSAVFGSFAECEYEEVVGFRMTQILS